MDDSFDLDNVIEKRRALVFKWGILTFSFIAFTLYGIFNFA